MRKSIITRIFNKKNLDILFARQTKKIKKKKKIKTSIERGDIKTQLKKIKRILKNTMNNLCEKLDHFDELDILNGTLYLKLTQEEA